MLAHADFGVAAEADEEASPLRVGSKAAKEVVADGGKGVVSAEWLVQTFLRLRCLRWCGRVHRYHGRKAQ